MTFPAFYQPERVGQLYAPDIPAAVAAGQAAGLAPASSDTQRILLLLIDAQIDFIHPDGSLSVPGAVDDTRRTIEWVLANAGQITTIAASLDSHVPIQIFLPTWWADTNGRHPDPFTAISSADVAAGRWQPLYEKQWSLEYVEKLEEAAKKQLMIWPFHTMIGTPGQSLVPGLAEAIAYHTAARQTQPLLLQKGSIPKTENYSIIEPEVKVEDDPRGGVNTEFLETIASYDRIYVAGQAKSHCVLETVASMVRYYPPETLGRIHILQDAMSSVAHPEIDFDAMADKAFKRFAENGLHLTHTGAALS